MFPNPALSTFSLYPGKATTEKSYYYVPDNNNKASAPSLNVDMWGPEGS